MPRQFLPLLAWLVVGVAALQAQQPTLPTHSITGTVTDAAGKALPDVSVELADLAAPDTASLSTSDATGTYRFDRILPGLYVLTFRLAGFGTLVRNVEVAGGGETRVDVRMAAAGENLPLPLALVPAPPKVVCGMTMIPVRPTIDPKGIISVPKAPASSVKPLIRTVQPSLCWDPAPPSGR